MFQKNSLKTGSFTNISISQKGQIYLFGSFSVKCNSQFLKIIHTNVIFQNYRIITIQIVLLRHKSYNLRSALYLSKPEKCPMQIVRYDFLSIRFLIFNFVVQDLKNKK